MHIMPPRRYGFRVNNASFTNVYLDHTSIGEFDIDICRWWLVTIEESFRLALNVACEHYSYTIITNPTWTLGEFPNLKISYNVRHNSQRFKRRRFTCVVPPDYNGKIFEFDDLIQEPFKIP
jgi:hypothetical protein